MNFIHGFQLVSFLKTRLQLVTSSSLGAGEGRNEYISVARNRIMDLRNAGRCLNGATKTRDELSRLSAIVVSVQCPLNVLRTAGSMM